MNTIDSQVAEYLQSINVSWQCIYVQETVRNGWICDEWLFCLKSPTLERSAEFEFYTGMAFRSDNQPTNPKIAGLLHSLLLDMITENQTFEQWCDDFGLNSDSITSLKTYKACQENTFKLKRMFSATQIEKLYRLLQDY